ncbi:MAG: RHS repeat-associated core domain-containing protein [Pirellulales bacterium]
MRSILRALGSRFSITRKKQARPSNREGLHRRFSIESLEPRHMMAADDLYYVSGSPSTNYTVRLTKTGGDSAFNNELNVFVVDDYTGKVNTVAPDYNSYFNAVKSLTAGTERWSPFNNQTPNGTTFDISVPGGTYVSFFTVQNGTVATAKASTTWFADERANSDFSVFEGTGEHYATTHLGSGMVQYGVEDRSIMDGGDDDKNDLVFRIETPTISYTETIGVTATDAEAREIAAGDSAILGKASFTFTRTGGSHANPMTLYFAIGGSATNGVDYVDDATSLPVGNSITIPANQSSATLTIRTLNDFLVEFREAVGVTLLADDPANPSDPPQTAPIFPSQGTAELPDNDIDGYNPQRGCVDGSCGPVGLNKQNGEAQIDLGMLHYNTSEPNPITKFSASLPIGFGTTSLVTAQLTFGNATLGQVVGPTLYYDPQSLSDGEKVFFAQTVDTSAMPTGHYPVKMAVTFEQGGNVYTQTFEGSQNIIRRNTSEFGGDWTNNMLDRLVIQGDGVTLLNGLNGTVSFTDQGGTFVREHGDLEFSTLVKNANGSYTLTAKDQSRSEFNALGLLTQRIDRNTNVTTYFYADKDGDTVADEIDHITDFAGRTMTFGYTAGLVTSITDFAGHVTTLGYNGGRLTSITEPDPDLPGSGEPAPVHLFQYDASGRIEKAWDPLNNETTVAYDPFTGRVSSITKPCTGFETLSAYWTKGLVDQSAITENGSLASPAVLLPISENVGVWTDELGHETIFRTDRYGNFIVQQDALDNITVWERNLDGQVVKLTEPDPGPAVGETPSITIYGYDSQGNLTSAVSADGATQSWEYHPTWNQVSRHVDQMLDETIFGFDARGNYNSERRVRGNVDGMGNTEVDDIVTTYHYTDGTTGVPAGLMDEMVDPMGRTHTWGYNARGLVTSEIHAVSTPDAESFTYAYDAHDNMDFMIDGLGRPTNYDHDNLHRLTKVTQPDPDGPSAQTRPVTQYRYNTMGLVTKIIDPLSRETNYTYNNRNWVESETLPDPDGPTGNPALVTQYFYDCVGNLDHMILPGNRTVDYQYDALNRLSKVVQPIPAVGQAAPTVEYFYDGMSRLKTFRDEGGNDTDYEYDELSRVTKVIQPEPKPGQGRPNWLTTYDAEGRVVTETDPMGRTTTYGYDELDRLSKVTLPEAVAGVPGTAPMTEYTYWNSGQLHSVTESLDGSNAAVTAYAYDYRDRLALIDKPNNELLSFEYDAVGNLKEIVDGNSNKTTFYYDGLDRVVQELDPRGKWKFFWYDAVGNMIQMVDRIGRYNYYAYDNMDRPIGESWGGTTGTITRNFSFSYDAAGRLSIASEGPPGVNSTLYSYLYDNLDRNTVQSHFVNGAVHTAASTQTWDVYGRRESVTFDVSLFGFSGSTNLDFTNEYVYDDLHRVDSIKQYAANAEAVVPPKLVDYEFNLAGDRTSITRYSDLAGTQLAGFTSYHGYDGVGRLTAMTHYDANSLLIATYNMSYDRGHRLQSSSHINRSTTGESQSYVYDAAGQLTSLSWTGPGGGGAETFSHDTNGNLTNNSGAAYANNPNNRIHSDGVFNYYYDDEGNVVQRIALVNGQPIGWTRNFVWDQRNRLLAIEDRYGGPGAPVSAYYSYLYDAFDRRVFESHVQHLGGGRVYFYDGEDVVLSTNTNASTRYLHGPAVDEVLSRDVEASATDVDWVYADHLGSVRDVVGNNSVQHHMDYTAFGQRRPGSSSWYYGFTGREYDHNTDLNYHRGRWLDSRIGRWLSEDPIGFAGGDANLNRYVGNQVTTHIDPSGLQSLFEQLGGEVKGPTASQLMRKRGPGRDDSRRVRNYALELERNVYSDIPNAAATAGDAVIEGLRCAPGGNSGVELGRLLVGQGSAEEFSKAVGFDLLYVDKAKKLIQLGMANPKLGFADDVVREFESFEQLKRSLGPAGEGKVWHHIVEQRARNIERFGARAIHCKDNVVPVPIEVNQKIAGYFSSKRTFTQGSTVREWMNSQSLEEQRRIGHKILDMVLTGQQLP